MRRRSRQSDVKEPPPQSGTDLISLLPDEVLGSIISLLPTKQGARTQILSSRWHPLWRSAPLNLDASGIRGISKAVVSRILSEHQGGGCRFSVSPFMVAVDPATLDAWLRSPALDNLHEFDLRFQPVISPRPLMPHSALRFSSTLCFAKFSGCQFPDAAAHHLHFPNLRHLALGSVTMSEESLRAMLAGCSSLERFVLRYAEASPRPQMPPSALHLSPTLRVVEFGNCQFTEAIPHHVHFPNLQILVLETVTISEGSLHAMVSRCPALNSLTLGYSSGFRQFRINSLKLKHVEMYFRPSEVDRLQDLIVENAPCLEGLDHRGLYEDKMHISIISAPKLKILGRLTDNISRLELGTTVFKGLHDARIVTVMHTVKVLALWFNSLRLDFIINFMKCFPCTEKLYIKTHKTSENMQGHYSQDCTECLDHHLKKLWISYYSGKKSHIEFATFFILNASVLESLVLNVDHDKWKSFLWIQNQRRQLQLERRASSRAQVEFTFDDCFNYVSDIYAPFS